MLRASLLTALVFSITACVTVDNSGDGGDGDGDGTSDGFFGSGSNDGSGDPGSCQAACTHARDCGAFPPNDLDACIGDCIEVAPPTSVLSCIAGAQCSEAAFNACVASGRVDGDCIQAGCPGSETCVDYEDLGAICVSQTDAL